jgi:hypothetical protein
MFSQEPTTLNPQTASVQPKQDASLFAVANSSPAAKAVFIALGDRQRFRRRTDLNRLYLTVQSNPKNSGISEDDFLEVFKDLQAIKAGSLVIGRKNNPNRFVWKYNLKELASAALNNKDLTELGPMPKKAPKRTAFRRKVKPTFKAKVAEPVPVKPTQVEQVTGPAIIQLTLQLSPNYRPEDVHALLQLAQSLQG